MEKFTCFYCGCPLHWESDHDIEDVTDGERQGILQCFSCPECGADYDAYQYNEKEKEEK